MEKDNPKKNSIFTVPPQEKEPEEIAAPAPSDGRKEGEGKEENGKKKRWILIGALSAVAAVALFILLLPRGGGNEEKPAAVPAATAAPVYSENGFSVDGIKARLLDRAYIDAFQGADETARRISYYETVFNVSENDTTYDSLAVPIELNAVPAEALKRSELVLCIHYTQLTASADIVEGKLILEGLPSGTEEKGFSLQGLFETGQIYVGLDELLPDSSVWRVGDYRLTLMLNGAAACVCGINLTTMN